MIQAYTQADADRIGAVGRIFYKIIRQGHLHRKGRVLFGKGKNGATTAGRNAMLDNFFRTPTTYTWAVGLINNSPTPTLAATDTMSSHAGWAEADEYDEANRPALGMAAASGAIASNTGSAETFTMNDTLTVYGIFIVSNNTKGGTTGVLWATGAFDATQDVVATDVIEITYEAELKAL